MLLLALRGFFVSSLLQCFPDGFFSSDASYSSGNNNNKISNWKKSCQNKRFNFKCVKSLINIQQSFFLELSVPML